jgi:hypothetical protein
MFQPATLIPIDYSSSSSSSPSSSSVDRKWRRPLFGSPVMHGNGESSRKLAKNDELNSLMETSPELRIFDKAANLYGDLFRMMLDPEMLGGDHYKIGDSRGAAFRHSPISDGDEYD